MVTRDQIVQWLETTGSVMLENKEYLTQLDAAIGDADHGINMARGFKKVLEKLPTVVDNDIGNILKTIGMTLISSVGGASGPLYGTFFMRSGMALSAKEELDGEDVFTMLKSGVEGIVQRGRPVLEDKTMYDAWAPALDNMRAALDAGKNIDEALEAAVAGAETRHGKHHPLQARKGRASYLGERSIGHQDPGATSSYLMLKALSDTVNS
ncbi:MAG: dihydroxyacetone kinase subunit DhaL [Chloroflexi bacterium]|nr:dihydroxyacetone kinase subunit DhaL [Chloroflexota bacterium]